MVVAVAVTLAAGSGDPEPLPEGSPEAAVQRFIVFIDDGNYLPAYRLLDEDARSQCVANDFRATVSRGRSTDMRVRLHSVDLFDGEASVTVEVRTFSGSPPFDFSESNYTATFQLRDVDGAWTVLSAPWPFSGCRFDRRLVPTPPPTATPTPTPTPAPAEPTEA